MDSVKEKQLKRFFPGCAIYRYDMDNKLEKYHIEKYNDSNDSFRVRDLNNETKYIKSDDILNVFILLNPDAIITFNIVKLQQGKDVMVCFHPIKEVSSIPYVVCRQSIIDVFSDMAYKMSNHYKFTMEEATFVGMSISQESCPADIDFNIVLGCESIEYTFKVAYYLGDSLDTILSYLFNKKKFNNVLANIILNGMQNYRYNVSGYCNNINELLYQTKFMADIQKYFKIKIFPYELKEEIIHNYVDNSRLQIFESMIGKHVNTMYIAEYNKTIDLDSLKREYVLGQSMNSSKLYIVGYD